MFDAVWDSNFREQIFRIMLDEQRASGKNGHLVGTINQTLAPATDKIPASSVIPGEQSNSSMLFENKFFLKLYRKLEDGVNPDVEVTRFLTERAKFPNVPAFGGAIEYRRGKSQPSVVCVLQSAIATEGDTQVKEQAAHVIYVPDVPEDLSPLVNVVPLQILAYQIAVLLGCDVA